MLFRSPTFRRVTIKMEDFGEITVLVADRATLLRHGLVRLLQERRPGWSCAEAGTAEEVQSHLSVEPVDLVLLDLPLAGGRALTGLRRLHELFPGQRIAVLADSDERGAILECLAAGANGYILSLPPWPRFCGRSRPSWQAACSPRGTGGPVAVRRPRL
jgi:CheY-like chemotaxis protein